MYHFQKKLLEEAAKHGASSDRIKIKTNLRESWNMGYGPLTTKDANAFLDEIEYAYKKHGLSGTISTGIDRMSVADMMGEITTFFSDQPKNTMRLIVRELKKIISPSDQSRLKGAFNDMKSKFGESLEVEGEILREGGMKAALEDFMYSLPKAAIADLKKIGMGDPKKMSMVPKSVGFGRDHKTVMAPNNTLINNIERVLKKHNIPLQFMGETSWRVIFDYFNTFHGESVEVNEQLGNYRVFHLKTGQQITVQANSTKEAETKGVEALKASNKKSVYVRYIGPVKESVEVNEQFKAGDKVKVPHKGKMVSGKIVRFDSGGTDKARQHGGGYVVDVGDAASILVPPHNVRKESVEVSENNFNYGTYGYRIDPDGGKFVLYVLSYNQGSVRFPDGRKGTVIGRFATKDEAIAKAKKDAMSRDPRLKESVEQIEEEKMLTGPGKKDPKRLVGIYTMQGKWIKDMNSEAEAKAFVNKSWGETISEDEWGGGFQTYADAQRQVQAGLKADMQRDRARKLKLIVQVIRGEISKQKFKKLTGISYDELMNPNRKNWYINQVNRMSKKALAPVAKAKAESVEITERIDVQTARRRFGNFQYKKSSKIVSGDNTEFVLHDVKENDLKMIFGAPTKSSDGMKQWSFEHDRPLDHQFTIDFDGSGAYINSSRKGNPTVRDHIKGVFGMMGLRVTTESVEVAEAATIPQQTKNTYEAREAQAKEIAAKILQVAKERGVRVYTDGKRVVSADKEFPKGDIGAFNKAYNDCGMVLTHMRFTKNSNQWGCESAGFGIGAQECVKAGRAQQHKSGDGGSLIIKFLKR